MKIRISCNMVDFLSAEAKMALDGKLPEFAAKTLAVAMRDRAESNARSRIGNGGFGQELAEGIRVRVDGVNVTIDHKSNNTNHLAEHVHNGGVIRAPGRRYLAIPIDPIVKGEYASDHKWDTPNLKPIVVRTKDGPNGRAYLAEPSGKRGKLKFLYVLTRQTKPQKPRPWWPSDDDFLELTERELAWWLKRYLPEKV